MHWIPAQWEVSWRKGLVHWWSEPAESRTVNLPGKGTALRAFPFLGLAQWSHPSLPLVLTICWKDGSDSSQLDRDYFCICKMAVNWGAGCGGGVHFNFPLATSCVREGYLNFTAWNIYQGQCKEIKTKLPQAFPKKFSMFYAPWILKCIL